MKCAVVVHCSVMDVVRSARFSVQRRTQCSVENAVCSDSCSEQSEMQCALKTMVCSVKVLCAVADAA